MPITSSSIFSSEADEWRAFLWLFVGGSLGLLLVLVGASVLLDPYDTGRFALVRHPSVREQGPRTANASRGRDPAFEAAIFGNSHIQLVSPENLRRATGIAFVSMIVPASGPKEQFVLLDYFLARHGGRARALVFGIDHFWCRPETDPPNDKPFPFWLYDPDPARYITGLLRYDTLERLVPRLQGALGLDRRPQARRDGYWDYEQYRTWDAARIGATLAGPSDSTPPNPGGRFPSIDKLGQKLSQLPLTTAVVLVRPPVYVTALSPPNSLLGRSDAGCREALVGLARSRPGTTVVDWRRDRPENRLVENYFDASHYRSSLARRVEDEIAAALTAAPDARTRSPASP